MTIFLICWGVLTFFVFLMALVDDFISHRLITFKSLLKMLWFGVWFPFHYIYYEYTEYKFKKRRRERMKNIRGDRT